MAEAPVAETDTLPAPGAEPTEPADRGHLVVENRAMVRIAEIAAARTPGVTSRSGGLARRHSPRADLEVRDNRVTARLEVAVTWPQSLSQVGSAVQRNVVAALGGSADLVVERVDVRTEPALPAAEVAADRVVR